jgi:hypothetical protein
VGVEWEGIGGKASVGGHRSWQVRQPAAQSRLRSSARGAAPPALCLLVFGSGCF